MGYLRFKQNYVKEPITHIKGHEYDVFDQHLEIIHELENKKQGVICFETYPGVDLNRLLEDIINPLNPSIAINIENYSKTEDQIDRLFQDYLTDDRVFGVWSHHRITDLYEMKSIEQVNELISNKPFVVVYGFGASLIECDTLIHVDITRWEIQLRYRKGLPNFKKKNHNEDILRKYKRGYFIEWRIADRIKDDQYHQIDYHIDYNQINHPIMLKHDAYDDALDQLVHKPFRMKPYFDPGVWGGQWMKEVFDLNGKQPNYAWSFDGVPEENSMLLSIGKSIMEIPAQDIVSFKTQKLMGNRVHGRFGKHFPIRFDMLDTMEGGNLSLQVHPLTEYIQDRFGMTYTQDESYYILDAKEDGNVYLGFKKDIDIEQFKKELIDAQKGTSVFDAEKYVNKIPAKRHDHFSIPAGTIHCSGKNTMVLEISACVYIFTFKLWDWERVGLDGKPRPVHLEHGFNALQYDRDTDFVQKELVNPIVRISNQEEITGLHEREFLETRRYTFDQPIIIETHNSVNMANLVDGEEAVIESIDASFEPFHIHYAETFIMPSTVKSFIIRPKNNGQLCKLIKAHVR